VIAKLFISTQSFLQAMPASGKVLEDSIRLSHIRSIKLTLYVVQAVMLIALAILLIVVLGGARVKPTLYLPLNSFIAVMVLLTLLLCLESFFFRILEIKFARSSSARHLMAKNSIKRSLMIVVFTGIVALVLVVPSIRGAIENTGTSTVDVPRGNPPSFYSSDPFALISVRSISVNAPKEVNVYLLEDKVYNQYLGNLSAYFFYRLNTKDYVVDPSAPLTISIPESGFVKYHLVLHDLADTGISATMTINKEMSPTFTGIVSLLLIAFVVTNIAWVAYLTPIERKYSVSSIYR